MNCSWEAEDNELQKKFIMARRWVRVLLRREVDGFKGEGYLEKLLNVASNEDGWSPGSAS